MSLRWIHENCEPPVVDEECSDIDDSCSDDSYDSDLLPAGGASDDKGNNNYSNDPTKIQLTRFHDPVNLTLTDNGKNTHDDESMQCDPRLTNNQLCQALKLKLFCRTGYYIGIAPSGRVKGFTADSGTSDAHVRFILTPVTCGVVRLQNADTGHYLAFNSTGHLYAEPRANKDCTEWEQWSTGKYDSFRSHKYADAGWWLAVKNNGRHKPGPKTAWAQKATQFVTIRNA